MQYIECLSVNNETNAVEFRELTEVMAENLSEIATVFSLNFVGAKTTVWKDREPRVVSVDRSTLMELKRRAIWRDAHLGWVS